MNAVAGTRPVVVAVDGSNESANALRWANAQAEAQQSRLRIITCYEHRKVQGESAGVSWDAFESTKHPATARALDVIEEVLGGADFEHVVTLGPVDSALLAHSADASMIVVGTRSSFGLDEPERSVTNRVTGRAVCPVLSIPIEADAA